MKILFCDDERSLGDCAKQIFLETDHDFLYTQTIDQSLGALDIHKFDIVIIDLHWANSEKTGFDIVDYIHEKNRSVRPLVYITSGYIERYREKLDSVSHLVDGIYRKPEELLSLLRNLAR